MEYTANSEGEIARANVKIKGNFIMIGKTLPIEFRAKVTFNDSSFEAEALAVIDRTKWWMDYSADPALGEHYIYSDVELHLKLKVKKKVNSRIRRTLEEMELYEEILCVAHVPTKCPPYPWIS